MSEELPAYKLLDYLEIEDNMPWIYFDENAIPIIFHA